MSNRTIGIIDYGMGNLLSVFHAVKAVGANVRICQNPDELNTIDKIIFPGVGAFSQCMSTLVSNGFVDALNEAVISQGKPILGICLGMQAMAQKSYEGGDHKGLGWFDAEVVRLNPGEKQFRVPHVGWNKITYQDNCLLFSGLMPNAADFYFVHSYYMQCTNPKEVRAICDYGQDITAAVSKNNIFAVQFHPEKSQDVGLKVLENFIYLDP